MNTLDSTLFLQIAVYEVLDIFPFVGLAVAPFRAHIKTPRSIVFLTITLYFLGFLRRTVSEYIPALAMPSSVLWIVFYAVFYAACIRADFNKLLFILLIILNYASFLIILSTYISYNLLGEEFKANPYLLRASLVILCCTIVTYIPMLWLLRRKIGPLLLMPENGGLWRILWLVPAIFCIFFYYNLHSNGAQDYIIRSPNNFMFCMVMNAGAYFIIYIVIKLVEETNGRAQLKLEMERLAMQSVQYETFNLHMQETRRARHDLRQNLAVISGFVESGNFDSLKDYLQEYRSSLHSMDSQICYCHNGPLNAVIVYYAERASRGKTDFTAQVDYPNDSKIADTDAVVVFGNLLENAIEACERVKEGARSCRLRISPQGGAVVALLDNTYCGELNRVGEVFYSSKHEGAGVGLFSINKIVLKYNGVLKIEADALEFHVKVLLNP